MTPFTGWSKAAYRARIKDSETQQRYEGGSPNRNEIDTYRSLFPRRSGGDIAVVLGMTPELRTQVAATFDKLITVERDRRAIAIYAEWLPEKFRARESIIQGDWFSLQDYLPGKVKLIVGDGVFGNTRSLDYHRQLLRIIHRALDRQGVFITRKVIIPEHFNETPYSRSVLIDRYRKGLITDDEFGFTMRILGFFSSCYDPKNFRLNNRAVFRAVRRLYVEKRITKDERDIVMRFYFQGSNCILPEKIWENILQEADFSFTTSSMSGKLWYDFFKIYTCKRTQ